MNAIREALRYHLASPIHRLAHGAGVAAGPMALPGFERTRWQAGRIGAWCEFQRARRRVPAYRELVRRHDIERGRRTREFRHAPVTDKATYVSAFSFDDRCEGGRIPSRGVVIDESSGTSGPPTNWVRGERERAAVRRAVSFGLTERFGGEPLFLLNAFALGPWATGINLMLTLSSRYQVKAVGPDVAKIENTLRAFGTAPHYVIMGYPPFLKNLVDRADIDWRAHRVSMCFGGEGISESMRRYLEARGIRQVFGSYGASDLEINIGAETPFTIALRRLLETRPELLPAMAARAGVKPPTGSAPMIFQFNPAEFFVETSASGELLVTVCRPGAVAPKIRYNIHDRGFVVRFPAVRAALAEAGVSPRDLADRVLDLPLMFLYGRSDAAVSFFGCKIPPADVQEALFRCPDISSGVDAFQLSTRETASADKALILALEVESADVSGAADGWAAQIFDQLAVINQDFRESRRMAPPVSAPRVELFARGTGPFAGQDARMKRKYIAG
jgi:phenylacetate-CoA ligase